MNYSNVYSNIDNRTVQVSKELLRSGIWKKDISVDDKVQSIESWLEKVSEIYNVPTPIFEYKDSSKMRIATGGGVYNPNIQRITLYEKFSIVTLFHEFRHHLQHSSNKVHAKMYRRDFEEDARAWSVSLFKTIAPKTYKKSMESGKLHFS